MADIQKSDDLELWLRDKPRAVAAAIAVRAALRVLPLLKESTATASDKTGMTAQEAALALAAFRATAVTWSAIGAGDQFKSVHNAAVEAAGGDAMTAAMSISVE